MFRLDLVISFVRFSLVIISKYHVHNTFYICSVDLDIVHPIPTAGVGTPRLLDKKRSGANGCHCGHGLGDSGPIFGASVG